MWVSAYPCIIKQLAYSGILFINVLSITVFNLLEVIYQQFDNFKPTRDGFDHRHAYQTNIIINDSATRMLLSYGLTIWTYQVHMYHIPRFQFFDLLRWQTSINSPSVFELLEYLSRTSIQFCLCEKTFPVAYFYNVFVSLLPPWWFRYKWYQSSTHLHRV